MNADRCATTLRRECHGNISCYELPHDGGTCCRGKNAIQCNNCTPLSTIDDVVTGNSVKTDGWIWHLKIPGCSITGCNTCIRVTGDIRKCPRRNFDMIVLAHQQVAGWVYRYRISIDGNAAIRHRNIDIGTTIRVINKTDRSRALHHRFTKGDGQITCG